jgi:hypothetical protein
MRKPSSARRGAATRVARAAERAAIAEPALNEYEREAVDTILDTLPGICRRISYHLDNAGPHDGMRQVLRHYLESALAYLAEDGETAGDGKDAFMGLTMKP